MRRLCRPGSAQWPPQPVDLPHPTRRDLYFAATRKLDAVDNFIPRCCAADASRSLKPTAIPVALEARKQPLEANIDEQATNQHEHTGRREDVAHRQSEIEPRADAQLIMSPSASRRCPAQGR